MRRRVRRHHRDDRYFVSLIGLVYSATRDFSNHATVAARPRAWGRQSTNVQAAGRNIELPSLL